MNNWNAAVRDLIKPAIVALGECFSKLLTETPNYDYIELIQYICKLAGTKQDNIEDVRINFGPNKFEDKEDFYGKLSYTNYEETFGQINTYLTNLKKLPIHEQREIVCDLDTEAYLKIYFNKPV